MTTAEVRAIGALVGLATGDAVGTTLEFKPPGTFEPLTDPATTDDHLDPYEPRLAAAATMRGLDLRRINLPIPTRASPTTTATTRSSPPSTKAAAEAAWTSTAGAASAAPAP